jgi:hypothetical protein
MALQSASWVRAAASSQQGFEFGEELLDRVEVRAVGRKVEQAGSCLADRGLDAEAFYSGPWRAGIRERYGMDPQIKGARVAVGASNPGRAVSEAAAPPRPAWRFR